MWTLWASYNMNVVMLSLMSSLLFWPVIGSAELYKWTDDQGNFHITDTPPPVTQRKATITVAPIPRSASPKKTTVRPTLPGKSQAEVHPVPDLLDPASDEVLIQRPMEGLSTSQAALTSSWKVFDGDQGKAKAPVQQWKDEQGLDHFIDVLPATQGRLETSSKIEDVSATPSTRKAKERATSASRSNP
jgi:hypothetical protein